MAVTAVEVRNLRKRLGLEPDHASDLVWHRRPNATIEDVVNALVAKRDAKRNQPRTATRGNQIRSANDPRLRGPQRSAPSTTTTPQIDQRSLDLVISSLGLPPALVRVFREEYIRSGKIELALAAVRQSKSYDTYYPGNRNEDGTVQYSEGEYRSVVDSYADSLSQYGVNPDIYARKFGNLIAGRVSAQEFRNRVSALHEVIGLRLGDEKSGGAWRQEFAEEFGVDPSKVTLASVLGVALDPEIGQEVLERRISIVQVTANATRFGFNRSRARAEALLNSGLQGEQAQQFYGAAAAQLPRLGAYAGRFNEGQFGIGEFEDAFALGDVEDQSRAERLTQREQSLFSRAGQVRQDQTGDLLGLQRR